MNFKSIDMIFVLVIGFVLGFAITGIFQDIISIQPLKREAIRKGYAEWVVIEPATGTTEFRFK